MNTPSIFLKHGGGVAPVWYIRLDEIAAVSEVYGSHGPLAGLAGFPERFGPFVDVFLRGGEKITLENCNSEGTNSLSTTQSILRTMTEVLGENDPRFFP
jgi:hypothetical protein